MDAVVQYLQENPLIALALLIVAVAFVLTLMKKLFKVAVVLLVIFLVAGGTVFHVSKQEVLEVLEQGRELGKDALEKGKDVYEKHLAPSDTARPSGTPDTLKPERPKQRRHKK